ncbi:hypothetical protein BJ138DRAFT_755199 [Hygrophoropsis aurantiaca]|uniref:Uncharacterized protein n=1 Tax=Hygrophoropsis aurantiaca TaxID=72124 RepID=A0ACB8AHA4_9AGAM|nr:hypothetical protein BJ138DRAFT_755199 [Hygrophoropsis aurantiaca]
MVAKTLKEAVTQYRGLQPKFKSLGQTLNQILSELVSLPEYEPAPIVSSRAKTVASFAGKIARKKYDDPCTAMTDLCGARVVAHTMDQVTAVCSFIRDHFEILEDQDVSTRSGPTNFSYRSHHFTVAFRPHSKRTKIFSSLMFNVDIPDTALELEGLCRAEIQVRTFGAHAWAELNHDLTYKSDAATPAQWEREMGAVAASLELVDAAFSRICHGLEEYAHGFTYKSNAAGLAELAPLQQLFLYVNGIELARESPEAKTARAAATDKVETDGYVITLDKNTFVVALRIAKLSNALGEWDQTIKYLSFFRRMIFRHHPTFLCELGIALCGKNAATHTDFNTGLGFLEEAVYTPGQRDIHLRLSLIAALKKKRDVKAAVQLQIAFETSPSDPAVLYEYLQWLVSSKAPLRADEPKVGELEEGADKELKAELQKLKVQGFAQKKEAFDAIIKSLLPTIQAAIQRCGDQISAGVNFPLTHIRRHYFNVIIGRLEHQEEDIAMLLAFCFETRDRAIITTSNDVLVELEKYAVETAQAEPTAFYLQSTLDGASHNPAPDVLSAYLRFLILSKVIRLDALPPKAATTKKEEVANLDPIITPLGPSIKAAIEKCTAIIEAKEELDYVYLRRCFLRVLIGDDAFEEDYKALVGLRKTETIGFLRELLETLEKLAIKKSALDLNIKKVLAALKSN